MDATYITEFCFRTKYKQQVQLEGRKMAKRELNHVMRTVIPTGSK